MFSFGFVRTKVEVEVEVEFGFSGCFFSCFRKEREEASQRGDFDSLPREIIHEINGNVNTIGKKNPLSMAFQIGSGPLCCVVGDKVGLMRVMD